MSNINSIINANQLPASQGQTTQNDALGKDAFMQLMMMQMKHQDPLNPMDNQAMLSQMAQFSSLEQMSNLNNNLAEANTMATFMDATRLLGKEVQILDPASPEDEPGIVESKVKSVNFTTEGPLLKLENGMVATVQDLIKVSQPAEE